MYLHGIVIECQHGILGSVGHIQRTVITYTRGSALYYFSIEYSRRLAQASGCDDLRAYAAVKCFRNELHVDSWKDYGVTMAGSTMEGSYLRLPSSSRGQH